jgi:hypothetical protein
MGCFQKFGSLFIWNCAEIKLRIIYIRHFWLGVESMMDVTEINFCDSKNIMAVTPLSSLLTLHSALH